MEEDNPTKGLTRRSFIKGVTLGAGVIATAGVGVSGAKDALAALPPKKWDIEADAVIVGFGAAGAVAAIAAHDLGSKVLIVEKAPEEKAGGNSLVCMQIWYCPDSPEGAARYQKAMNEQYLVPEDVVQAWAEEMTTNTDFVKSLGGAPKEYPNSLPETIEFSDYPGADSTHTYFVSQGWGNSELYKLLKANVEKRGIKVLYGTPAKELVQDRETGAILGLRCSQDGKTIAVKARKGVVLTCGGFEGNLEMIRDYLANLPYCYPAGSPYNTGDGIKMAQAVGADLWHMMNISGPGYGFRRPDADCTMLTSFPADSYFFVGADGTRFVNEKIKSRHGKVLLHGREVPHPTPLPVHAIFDETVRKAGPIFSMKRMGWGYLIDKYEWSKDNAAEIEKGWIFKAGTITELAGKLKLPPATLEKALATYNECCQSGADPQFGRPQKTLKAVSTPPYYAMPLTPYFINTQGGPRRNAKAQILSADGTAIPRLYSAGELGSVYSYCYQGGGNIGECMVFGRIAARNVHTQKPWK